MFQKLLFRLMVLFRLKLNQNFLINLKGYYLIFNLRPFWFISDLSLVRNTQKNHLGLFLGPKFCHGFIK